MEFRSGCRLGFLDSDHISTLTDDLLLLILARLPCIKVVAHTSILSRRWCGLWAHLRQIIFREVVFDSIEPALRQISCPPAVSLLEIHAPEQDMASTAQVNSLLSVAAELEPKEFVASFPSSFGLLGRSIIIDLPCFHRTTCIMLDHVYIRSVPVGVEFPMLEALSLLHCNGNLDALLSCCPRLCTLLLSGILFETCDLRVNSPSLQELVVNSFSTEHVNIVAPMLKKLEILFTVMLEVNISVLAPIVENVWWYCCYTEESIVFGLWYLELLGLQVEDRQGQLPLLHIRASVDSSLFPYEPNFAQEIEKHMVVDFSLLELDLKTDGHVFGALVFYLLQINQISSSLQKLKILLLRSVVKEECPTDCPCESTNWRSQAISLTALEEVQINGFEGVDHEFDLLKQLLVFAPKLKKIIVKLTQEVSSSNTRRTKIYNVFETYGSAECFVYLSSGLIEDIQNQPSA
ncbi:uncharacterized protein [Aegilops tauschii subsp. strangulata]|nr:F-box/FBD/LRR-repeat protein At3g51530-like [Aegilops tauschii subsp. strangulata]